VAGDGGEGSAVKKRLNAPLFFAICAVVDFVFGCINWHSVVAGLVGIVCGLPLTALLYFLLGASGSGSDDPR
jgi:hypothetical protein